MSGITTGTRLEKLEALHRRTEHDLASARRRVDDAETARLTELLGRLDQEISTEKAGGGAAVPTPTSSPTQEATPVTPTQTAPRPASPARVAAVAENRPRLIDAPITELHPDPDNPRTDVGDVTELAESMESVGLLQPIVARRDDLGRLVIVAGHRRHAAALHLRWRTIQVVIRRDIRADQVLAAMLIENSHRRDLDPIEEARALSKISADHGTRSQDQLAALIGRTQAYVSGRLALLSLPIEEQDAIRAGEMNVGDGIRRGRLASGRVREPGSTGHSHLGVEHDLASRARARCTRMKHKRGGRNSVGGVACGECWESVIRADEREHLEHTSNKRGRCVLCDTEKES